MSLTDYQHLTFERRDPGILLITLNRPEKFNAADEQMHAELARVWTEVSADPDTRVAVVTGAGKAFSAGGDLDMVERIAGNHEGVANMLDEMSDLVYNMINCAKPIVSAINGVAVGAGTVVALWPTSPSVPRTPESVTDTSSSASPPATTRRSFGRCWPGWPRLATTC